MQDLNKSDSYRDRDLLDVVLQKKEEQQVNESGISIILPRDNGNLDLSRPSSFMSKQSITFSQSQDRLSDVQSVLPDKKSVNLVIIRIYSLAIICLTSLIICGLNLQLLYSLGNCQSHEYVLNGTLMTSHKMYDDVLEVATAFSTFVLVLDVNCILVCSMQCFITAKLLKVESGEERATKYLSECSSSRFIAVIGFFASLPLFLMSVMLFIVMKYKSTPAITSVVIISIGAIFCILSVMQNIYQWRSEINAAEEGRPVYGTKSSKTSSKTGHENKLSTLV